jgi:pimeloyl-ACP methyl ester carboxylesterase
MIDNGPRAAEASPPSLAASSGRPSRRRFLGATAALVGAALLPPSTTSWAVGPARPLMLVHGLNGQATIWQDPRNAVVSRLLRAGYTWSPASLTSFTYPPRADGSGLEDSSGDIAAAGLRLARQIIALTQQIPGRQVDLLGFSMGGLVGRWAVSYLQRLEPSQRPLVNTLTLLGTPNGGADVLVWLGDLAREAQLAVADLARELLDFDVDSEAAQEMVPGSSFLQALNTPEAVDPRVRYVTIAGRVRLQIDLRLFGAAISVGDGLISTRSAALTPIVASSRYELPESVQVVQEAPWQALSRAAVFHPKLLFNDDVALIVANELLPDSSQLRAEIAARQRAGAIEQG